MPVKSVSFTSSEPIQKIFFLGCSIYSLLSSPAPPVSPGPTTSSASSLRKAVSPERPEDWPEGGYFEMRVPDWLEQRQVAALLRF